MKFEQLILSKIIKIVATRSQILRLKCTKIDFSWGSAPDPARELLLGSLLQCSPSPANWNKGILLLREEEGHREGGGERERKWRERRETEGRGRG